MSVNAYKWAWYEVPRKLLRDGERTVLLCLAEHADPDGFCRPSYERLASMCDCNRATIYRRLQRLMDLGLVLQVRRGSSKGASRRSNEYRLNLTAPAQHKPMNDIEYARVNRLDPDDQSRCATGSYPQPSRSDATGDQLQIATGAPDDPSRDATGPVASERDGTRRAAVQPQPYLNRKEPSARAHASCGERHVMPHTGEIVSCAEWGECQFRLTDEQLATNRLGLEQARAAIAAMGSKGGGR